MSNQIDLFETQDPDQDKRVTFSDKRKIFIDRSVEIAQAIIEQMKVGDAKWEMPWHKGLPIARNLITGKDYGGQNVLILWQKCVSENYKENLWGTFKQWQKRRAKVRKGEKGTLICHAIPKIKKNHLKLQVGTQLDLDFVSQESYNLLSKTFSFKFIYVFNIAQVSGFDFSHPDLFKQKTDDEILLRDFITATKAEVRIGGDRAFYQINNDFIQMPELARFQGNSDYPSQEKYNSTLLHELIHWTGHHTRCNRTFGQLFGDKAYAFEELVAELGGAILSTKFHQRVHPRKDHSQYLNSWISVLENDFSYLTEALEIARTSIFWLSAQSDVSQILSIQNRKITLSEKRLEEWNTLA